MKLTVWLSLIALTPLTAVSVLAQNSNPPPSVVEPPSLPPAVSAPATGTNETATAPVKHKTKHAKAKAKAKAKKPAEAVVKNSTIILNPPVEATVKCEVLDVRGQGSFAGEVIGHVKKGENVTVLEELTLAHPQAHEPAQWSEISVPTNVSAWVSGDFIDHESMTVKAKKINVRGGPGENYSVLARLEKGAPVKEIGKKNGWLKIEAPTNATAFVASEYLEKAANQPAPEVASAPAPAPAPAPTPVVVNVPTPEPAPAPAPGAGLTAPAPTAASQSDQEAAAARAAAAPTLTAPNLTPLQAESGPEDSQRIVTREGFVHHARNIQAPAGYELHDIKTGELTEYLLPAPGQKFKVFVGTRVRITGPEFLDPDWPRTPVLHVQTADLMP